VLTRGNSSFTGIRLIAASSGMVLSAEKLGKTQDGLANDHRDLLHDAGEHPRSHFFAWLAPPFYQQGALPRKCSGIFASS